MRSNIATLGVTLATLMLASVPAAAFAQAAGSLVAQNTYTSPFASGQDSILSPANDPYIARNNTIAGHQEVLRAETNVRANAAFMHTQYHENITPGSGDDENGLTYGFGVGASVLMPLHPGNPISPDLYTSLDYDLSAGNITYGGHFLVGNAPVTAVDRAVFNRLEARIGVGFPLQNGGELIPFFAAGYQAWNRNIDQRGSIGTNEFYETGLIGGGLKLDVPVTPRLVLSATGEMLAMIGANVTFDSFGISHSMGVSAQERISLGADYAVSGRFHAQANFYWEHFNYAGFSPTPATFGLYEPLSTTTQFGLNAGIAYDF